MVSNKVKVKNKKTSNKPKYLKSKKFFKIYDSRVMAYGNQIINRVPKSQRKYMKQWVVDPLPLRVIVDRGVSTDLDFKINVTDLYLNAKRKKFKNFYTDGSGGIVFKIKILIKQSDKYVSRAYSLFKGKNENTKWSVSGLLKGYYEYMIPLNIVTYAMDVPNGKYLITDISNMNQTFKGSTVWELEFTTYRTVTMGYYKNNNAAVKSAIKKANSDNSKKKTASNSNATVSKLRKCKLTNLVYSKKQKTVTCVKYLQTVLYKKGYLTKKQVDGWYGPVTLSAVKKYQKAYNKSKGVGKIFGKTVKVSKTKSALLSVNGKVDKATFNALTGSNHKELKNETPTAIKQLTAQGF